MNLVNFANNLKQTIPLTQDSKGRLYLPFLKEHLKSTCEQLENLDKNELEKAANSFGRSRTHCIY